MNVPLTPIRFLRYAEQQYPKRTAVVCGRERLNYAQFAERVGRLAGALRKTGVRAGDRVAFLSTNCHRLLEAYYGVIEAGAVLLPLNIRLAPQELAYILNDAGARVLFLQSHFLELVESFRPKLNTIKTFYPLDAALEMDWLAGQDYETLPSAALPHRSDIMQWTKTPSPNFFIPAAPALNPKA